MENSFSNARMNSSIDRNYDLKRKKITTARDFINLYIKLNGEPSPELKEIACLYNAAHNGGYDIIVTESDCEKISEDELKDIYKEIKDKSAQNFVKFYKSYLRKIEQRYYPEYVQNALSDLKTSYHIYRKVNNPLWDLQDSQITESEMKNLYCLLMPNQEKTSIIQKTIEEK